MALSKTRAQLHLGDNREIMALYDENRIDAVVTDPPYELGFMGKGWDSSGIAYDVKMWRLVLRLMKPGAHLLAFGGTRTYHRMVCAIEDAGFEVRDQIQWLYGSGFPKSMNVGKAIDKKAGANREVVGIGKGRTGKAAHPNGGSVYSDDNYQWPGEFKITKSASKDAKLWDGFGTALKPANEPICLARKPMSEKTVIANLKKWGVGCLNIDACRVEYPRGDDALEKGLARAQSARSDFRGGNMHTGEWADKKIVVKSNMTSLGRWPANVIHDGSDEVLEHFPESTGSAARFFYCTKTSKSDRNEGMKGEAKEGCKQYRPNDDGTKGIQSRLHGATKKGVNNHPTVKPSDLMRYLCRLVTPPAGAVLDPFMGSGSTGKAATFEGFRFAGIEKDPAYFKIAQARVAASEKAPHDK